MIVGNCDKKNDIFNIVNNKISNY